MRYNFQTPDSGTLAIFVPVALSVLVLIPTIYLNTRRAADPGQQPPPQRQLAVASQPAGSQSRTNEAVIARDADTDFARHIERLKKRLPARGFTILIRAPFVVIGDGTPEAVRA